MLFLFSPQVPKGVVLALRTKYPEPYIWEPVGRPGCLVTQGQLVILW